jgi:hypothetical protein
MPSSGILHRVALIRTDVSEERIASIIRVTRMCKLGTTLASSVFQLLVAVNVVPSSLILVTVMIEAIHSSETSILTGTTRRNIPEDCNLHSHRRENHKYYMDLFPSICSVRPSDWGEGIQQSRCIPSSHPRTEQNQFPKCHAF